MSLKSGRLRSGLRNVSEVIAIPDSGLMHRWPFDEGSGTTVNDSEGDIDGTITGATWVSGTGNGDSYLDFDGEDDIVEYGRVFPDSWDELTVSVWTDNIDSDGSNDYVVKHDSEGSAGSGFILRQSDTTEFEWRLDNTVTADVSEDSGWRMLTLTFDGTEITAYLDKSDVGSTTTDMPTWEDGDEFNVGASSPGSNHYEGGIDDPKIWDRALSSSEISDLYGGTEGFYFG